MLQNIKPNEKECWRVKKSTWLCDTGASTHMGPCTDGLIDAQPVDIDIKIGNKSYMKAMQCGKKKGTVVQKDGTTMNVVMDQYLVVPDLWVNLYALNSNLNKGWNLGNEKEVINYGGQGYEED